MKQYFLVLVIILIFSNQLYAKGSDENSPINKAKVLLEEKKYNEAIALLTTYVGQNPSAIYEVQDLLDVIRKEREKSNEIMDELIKVLYDEEDFDKGFELIKKLEDNNPFPDDLSKTFMKNAREGATFVINQKQFKEYMDIAYDYLKAGEYGLALDNYLLCLDFHKDEFDLLMSEDVSDVQNVELNKLDDDVSINNYYTTLKNSSFKEVEELKTEVAELKDYISKIIKAYNSANSLLDSTNINLLELENSLKIFREIPSREKKYNLVYSNLENYNELFSKVSVNGEKSKFISYAMLTMSGRKDIDEGVFAVIGEMYPLYIDGLISKIESKIKSNFNNARDLFSQKKYSQSENIFNIVKNNLNALNITVSIWNSFINIDSNFNIERADILKDKYPYFGDSMLGNEVINYYIKLSNILNERDKEYLNSDLLALRQFLEQQLIDIDSDNKSVSFRSESINNRKILSYNISRQWAEDLLKEYQAVKNEYREKEIEIVNSVSRKAYIAIFGLDADKIVDGSDLMEESIINAAKPINIIQNTTLYFDINNTDERTVPTYDVEKGLQNLEEIEEEYIQFINNLENYIKNFENEKSYIFSNELFKKRYTSVEDALNSATRNREILISYKEEANSKIIQSKELENRLVTIYENALTAFETENFNESRRLIESGKGVAISSISYNKNSFVIDELIPALYNLNNEIVQEEARIVIRDVRKLITEGKTKYLEGSYILASNIFRDAELRWSETNIEPHPEIPYWLALIRDALDIESGRYLNVTEPLYSVLAGYLSFAENYYVSGLKEENKVNKLKLYALADSYVVKVLEVRPLNERARFLQLQVLKSKDPDAFKVIFSNEFNRYRLDVIKAIDNNPSLESNQFLDILVAYEEIITDAYRLNPRLSNSRRRALLERFYKPVSTSGKSASQIEKEKNENEENRKKINESYIRFKDLLKIADDDQKSLVQRVISLSEVALGFRRLPVDTSNIRESNQIFLNAQNRLKNTDQTEIDTLNSILADLKRALTLNPGNDEIPVVMDEILVMLGEESNFQLAPTEDKIFREAQKDFIDGRYYDAKDKIIEILKANSKNKNYPKLKELINRVEIKIKEEITI